MKFTIYQGSLRGGRKVNQDFVAHSYGREALLLVVADGVGSSAAGEIASRICARLFVEAFQREAKPIVKSPLRFLQESMRRVHEALVAYARQVALSDAPRTTCVACVVQGGRAWWAHVGDSRLYLIRGQQLLAETVDHSHVQILMQKGVIAADEATTHPDRHRIFSCLGGEDAPVIDLAQHDALAPGDLLVLSTDGFWGALPKDEIARALDSRSVLEVAPELIGEAARRGGEQGDNVSAVVLRWGREDVAGAPAPAIPADPAPVRA